MPRYTEKTEISYDDYLRLEGLLTLARDVVRQERQLAASVASLIGEADPNSAKAGHASDAVWSGYTARELLEKSEIKLLPPEVH